MADSAPLVSEPAGWRGRGLLRAARGGGQRGLRPAMYMAFLLLALAVVMQGGMAVRQSAARASEAELLDRAGLQRSAVQELGRHAALLAADPAARHETMALLAPALQAVRHDRLQLEALARAQVWRSDEAARRVGMALEQWQSASERLWQRADRLLQAPVTEPAARAVWLLQADLAPADAAARDLALVLRRACEERAEQMEREVRWGMGAVLVLLGLLSIAVVEPTALSVARNLQRLAEQGADVQRLALVAEHTTAVVAITDRESRIQWVNAAFTRATGWTADESPGLPLHLMLTHPQEDTAVRERLEQAVRAGQGLRTEWLRSARDGRDLWLDMDLRPVHDAAGAHTGFVLVATDVTARVQQQGKLQALWAALPAGVVVQAEDGTIVDGNRAAERLLGVTIAEMRAFGARPAGWRLVREDGGEFPLRLHPSFLTLRSGQPLFNQTIGVQTPDGNLRWLLINTEPQHDPKGKVCGVITCFSDITEARALQQQLRAHARTDALTQLPNRAVVMERLQQAIAHADRHAGYGFAVLFMDFDRFKLVNDTRGHPAGDELLRQIAERLKAALRPGDAVALVQPESHVAARIGGDEFVVVLDGVATVEAVTVIAQRLLADLSQPYIVESAPLESSASIGVVLYHAPAPGLAGPPGTEARAEELLRNADTAMYEAKRAGRGRWVLFDDSMHERVVRAIAMETELRHALKADELFVVYQPVLDLATDVVVGVEALVRWAHPVRGLVPPVEFIGLAEECGLIDAVGEVVLRKACTQFMAWRESLGAMAPLQVSVNLSRAQTQRATLVDDVRAVLAAARMPPECLQLEVTESLAAQDERMQGTLRDLKSLGVRLALDDFGTGYSSLACLHLLPVDIVKIDRTFVQNAENKEYHRVLIEATIRVARTLGMATVAEGIETERQAALMLQLECDRGQGYLYARPLDAEALEGWLRQHHEQQVLPV